VVERLYTPRVSTCSIASGLRDVGLGYGEKCDESVADKFRIPSEQERADIVETCAMRIKKIILFFHFA
jgi:hypothetical protein